MTRGIYLALGSNIGDRENNLLKAIRKISELKTTSVLKISGIYDTKPVGYLPQQNFLNMVIEIETCFEPFELLAELQKIEDSQDRTHQIHWGPRKIDIDILLYDDMIVNSAKLSIPHERMFERAFVLVPLKDIYPSDKIRGSKLEDLISRCDDVDGVVFYKKDVKY